MNFKKDISGTGGVLTLEGDLTIRHSRELREVLKESQDATDSLLINLEGATATDLSCLQLLCSAHRTSLKINKELRLIGAIPACFRQTARDAGFNKDACRADSGGNCLWTKIRGES